jgi:HflC protein
MNKLAVPLLLLGALAVLLVSRAAYVVDQAEQAIIVQFGEPIGGVVSDPGLHWRMPFIQEVRRFDKRLLDWDGDVSQIPTLGREFIIVDTTARWRIADPLQFLRSVRDELGARTRLDDILDSATRDVVSGTDLEEIVRSADWQVDVSRLSDEDVAALEQTDLARPQHEVVCVVENDLAAGGFNVIGRKALDRRFGAHWHERWRVERTVQRVDAPQPCCGFVAARGDVEAKRSGHAGRRRREEVKR